jgi:hypothetical protein
LLIKSGCYKLSELTSEKILKKHKKHKKHENQEVGVVQLMLINAFVGRPNGYMP